MKPAIIAVIGAPGVGKSFLAKKLAEYLKAELILERVEDIPENIIQNLRNDAEPVKVLGWFRDKQIKEINKALKLKSNGKIVVMDTCLITNELHITTMTSGIEQKKLLEQAKVARKNVPKPDVIIYLDASENKIKELTLKRGRDFDTNEKFIQRYLSIRKAHQEYYNEHKDSLIYINRENLDFEKEEDLKKVVEKINDFPSIIF